MFTIVLAHGFFGFAEMAGIEYFLGVKKHLTTRFPGLNIIITEVAPNDVIADRAAQLWEQVEKIDEQVHLVGHSMGGLDARFMLSPEGLNKSEKAVSLTTISTPHWGSPLADFIIERLDFGPQDIDCLVRQLPSLDREAKKIIKALKEAGEVWRYLLELGNFTTKAMTNFTPAYLKQFNQKYADAPQVKYFSYAGVTGPGERDWLQSVLYVPWAIIFLNQDEKSGGRNDGLVAVNSARWGDYKGEIPADHFKQVGYDVSGVGCLRRLLPRRRAFNHLKFFEQIVNDLLSLERTL